MPIGNHQALAKSHSVCYAFINVDIYSSLCYISSMNLHRAEKQGDWANIPEQERNIFQKIAAKTDGVVTPGNITSVAGGLLVLSGLRDIYKGRTRRGIAKIGIGRIGDLIDGTVADKTGTKGPKGEATDAGVDKALMAATLPVLVKRGVLPLHAAGLIGAQNIASAGLAVEAKKRGHTLHPSEEGKKAVFGQWSVVGLYVLAAAARKTDSPRLAEGIEATALASLVASTALGTYAVDEYRRELQNPPAEVTSENIPGSEPK